MSLALRTITAALVACVILVLLTFGADAQSGEAEVRISARNAADGRVEFALQERDASGRWNERILPAQRFFPNVDHTRWLNSSPITVESVNAVARIIARNNASGAIEFGLQWGVESGQWIERILPQRRFFPDVDHTRWLNSSPVDIGEAPQVDSAEGATPTFSIFASAGAGQPQTTPTRWTLVGPQPAVVKIDDRETPTFEIPEGATAQLEFRESDELAGGYAAALIFSSGFELILHPDTIDDTLARTDISDRIALAVVESIRRSIDEAGGTTTTETHNCHVESEPFTTSVLDVGALHCIHAMGSGTLTVQYQNHAPLTMTLPADHPEWLIDVAGSSWEDGTPALYVMHFPELWQALVLNWTTGAEVRRIVDPGPNEANLNALFDSIAASVAN